MVSKKELVEALEKEIKNRNSNIKNDLDYNSGIVDGLIVALRIIEK